MFRVVAVGYFALIGWQAFTLPDDVPGQLDFAGEVTRWGLGPLTSCWACWSAS